MITIEQALIRTINVIDKSLKHRWYDRTVELAELLSKLITGEKIDTLLKQIVKRENKTTFEQRKVLTEYITPSIAKTLMDVSYKVPRSNGMKRILLYKESQKSKQEEFIKVLNRFWGTKSWDDYMAVRFIELNYIDPNSFIVFEWKPFDGDTEHAQPFPFEVSSEMAIDYVYTNEILQYLLVKSTENQFLEESINRHTLYLQNQTITFDLIDIKEKNESIEKFTDKVGALVVFSPTGTDEEIAIKVRELIKVALPDEPFKIIINTNAYEVKFLKEHKLKKVPAVRVGYVPDLFTKRRTFRNPFDAAIPFLKKSIKTVSELDITMADHAHPQKLAYQPACLNCNGSGQAGTKECPKCKGKRYQLSTSSLDAITIVLPHNATPDVVMDIEKLVKYVVQPVDIIKLLDAYVDKLVVSSWKAIYGNQSVQKDNVTATATESLLDLSKTYDALHPLTQMYSRTWEFGIEIISLITDLNDGLTASMMFSKDLKFLDKMDYIQHLKGLQEAGGSETSKNIVNNEIVRLDLSESPMELKKYIVMQEFLPFNNKSKEERIALVSALSNDNPIKVLYTYFDRIFLELEIENSPEKLYNLPISEQMKLIDKKVEEFIVKFKAPEPILIPPKDNEEEDNE